MTTEMLDYVAEYGYNTEFEQADREDEAQLIDQFFSKIEAEGTDLVCFE